MKVEVEMRAFQGGLIREVEIPDNLTDKDDVLNAVFYWGQNDFQPVPGRCSVSVGDVIRWQGNRYRVEAIGFSEIEGLEKGGQRCNSA